MRVAVIDIGSNAIRTSVYTDNTLGASEIYNEKFKSDILNLLENDDLNVKHTTYSIFNYFQHIFRELDVTIVQCVATEVLRGHSKSAEFIKLIYDRYKFNIEILDGASEARLSAIGLMSGIRGADGIVTDLGGGSLELARVKSNKITEVASLPIGTKVLMNEQIDLHHITTMIDQSISKDYADNVYLIGGAFRLIGRCYMEYSSAIVKNLHYLKIELDDALRFLNDLESLQKFQQFFKQYKISRQAILVIRSLIQKFSPKVLIISTFGLKEGVRFNLLPASEQSKNIIFERCINITKNYFLKLNYDPYNIVTDYKESDNYVSLHKYLLLYKNLGIEIKSEFVDLLYMSIILINAVPYIDRNFRAESNIDIILSADIPLSDIERCMLIVVMLNISSQKNFIIPKYIKRMLHKTHYCHANIIGALLKIAILIDGPMIVKPSFNIVQNDRYLEIQTPLILPKLIFEKICEQLKKIGILRKYV